MDTLTNLLIILFLPLVTSLLIIALGKYRKQCSPIVAFLSSVAVLGLTYILLNKSASKKAFIVNRVGDFGFLIGIILTYWQFGTTDLGLLSIKAGLDPSLTTSFVGFLLICGFIGKSAQFPLHVWLPDAMAGPTPVSALIHAATMVAAGIYLLIRIDFILTSEVLTFIAYSGTFVACIQRENEGIFLPCIFLLLYLLGFVLLLKMTSNEF